MTLLNLISFHRLPARRLLARSSVSIIVALAAQVVEAQEASPPAEYYATPDKYAYADPAGGREPYSQAGHPVNEFRLYDFYARQADAYRQEENPPALLPAFPGLDAGLYGYWGKNSDFGRIEDRWHPMVKGPVAACVVELPGESLVKAICIRLGNASETTAVFDPLRLGYRAIWHDGFLKFSNLRWGLLGNAAPASELAMETLLSAEGRFIGYHLSGNQVVLEYEVSQSLVLECPSVAELPSGPQFRRIMEFPHGAPSAQFPLGRFASDQVSVSIIKGQSEFRLLSSEDHAILEVLEAESDTILQVDYGSSSSAPVTEESFPSALTARAGPRWPGTLALPIQAGTSRAGFAVDSFAIPLANPYRSPMFLSGLAFFSDGRAAIATFFGDVWIVEGLEQRSGLSTWKRFATGLNNPLGLEVMDDVLHVIGRDQLTALHDRNGDGEADFYENVFNDFKTYRGTHDFNMGLASDAEKNLYFAATPEGIKKINGQRDAIETFAEGIRNPNGIAVSPDGRVFITPQEGNWTPVTMVIEAERGGFYGFPSDRPDKTVVPPLAYLARGLDNSAGSPTYLHSERWGPLKGQLLGLSYGYASSYIVLKSEVTATAQGAVIPMGTEFTSGAHRAEFNPVDGELYVAGLQGWGNYAQFEGSLHRLRRTEEPLRFPVDFAVHANGISLRLDSPLDEDAALDRSRYFAQQWNYRYSPGYGSPEYSTRLPKQIGHDTVPIRSISLSEDQLGLFIELPDLRPAMQTHLRLELPFADGGTFKTELFLSALELAPAFDGASDLAPIPEDKVLSLNLSDFITTSRNSSQYD